MHRYQIFCSSRRFNVIFMVIYHAVSTPNLSTKVMEALHIHGAGTGTRTRWWSATRKKQLYSASIICNSKPDVNIAWCIIWKKNQLGCTSNRLERGISTNDKVIIKEKVCKISTSPRQTVLLRSTFLLQYNQSSRYQPDNHSPGDRQPIPAPCTSWYLWQNEGIKDCKHEKGFSFRKHFQRIFDMLESWIRWRGDVS